MVMVEFGLPGCAAPFYVSLRSKQQSLRYPGKVRDVFCFQGMGKGFG